jgi:hypothetical protein
MAEIICVECNSSVSDVSGYCPECGYPFDIEPTGLDRPNVKDEGNTCQETISAPPLDIVSPSLDAVRLEIDELQKTVNELRQGVSSLLVSSVDDTNKILAEIAKTTETLASLNSKQEAQTQAENPNKTKKGLLAAFYETLNSPNSMFEYMFYICVVQIIFVIVNLLLAAYIVSLVRP